MKGKIFVGLLTLLASSCLMDDTITPYEQLIKDVNKIDQYLADNGITGVIKDASGLRIKINTLGTAGLPPNLGNELEIDYTGKLLSSGVVFADGLTTFLPLGNYINGWKLALPMLPEGTVATLYIPSVLGYGKSGSGAIPPNANLIFDVELVSVDETPEQIAKLTADKDAIDSELAEFHIAHETHDSGLRYVLTPSPDPGTMPTLFSSVKVSYKAMLLSDSSVYVNRELLPSSNFSSRVANYPPAVMIGLQLMKEGDKATFFAPSVLAFGTQSNIGLPANSNMVFEIELIDVY
jgi:peptidylprolyl isomerase